MALARVGCAAVVRVGPAAGAGTAASVGVSVTMRRAATLEVAALRCGVTGAGVDAVVFDRVDGPGDACLVVVLMS